MPDAERPIFISGLGRSGTTWMQWFLSQHPRIHVHGQLPNNFWTTTQNWFQTLLEQGRWAEAANRQVGYEIAHYAGSGPERCRHVFRRMYRDFLTGQGPDRPRWGLKLIGFCAHPAAVAHLETLWPEARWVVCLRDPFTTINSTRNTLVPGVDPREQAQSWVAVWRFLETHNPQRVVAVPMDRLQHRPEQRRPTVDRLLACIGESFYPELECFLEEWPVVHKVVPDARRSYQLSEAEQHRLLREVPDLERCLQQFRETGRPLPART